MNGRHGGHFKGWGAHRVICWDCGCAQTRQKCPNLCGLYEVESEHLLWKVHPTISGANPCLVRKCNSFLEAGCEFKFLADWTVPGVYSLDNFNHTIRELMLLLPILFGITSAPEHFQRPMMHTLSGLSGVVCLNCWGYPHLWKTQEEYDHEKCELHRPGWSSLDKYVVDQMGIRPDQDKVNTISWMQ